MRGTTNLPFVLQSRAIVIVIPGTEAHQVLGQDHHLPPAGLGGVALQAGEVLVDVVGAVLPGWREAAVVTVTHQPLPQHPALLACKSGHRTENISILILILKYIHNIMETKLMPDEGVKYKIL